MHGTNKWEEYKIYHTIWTELSLNRFGLDAPIGEKNIHLTNVTQRISDREIERENESEGERERKRERFKTGVRVR